MGLVSRSGIIPISSSQDTAGPMGKTLEIVAKTLEVISGYDPNDKATALFQKILITILWMQQIIGDLMAFDLDYLMLITNTPK